MALSETLRAKDELTIDAAERALVEQHPAIGARLVKPLAIPNAIASAIQHHHEWWDGTGYPDGLNGDEIPPSWFQCLCSLNGVLAAVDQPGPRHI